MYFMESCDENPFRGTMLAVVEKKENPWTECVIMVEERVYVDRGVSGVGLFLGLLLVVAIVGGVLWATGALEVRRDPQNRVEITLDPSRAEHAGDDVIDKTGKALESAGEKMQRQTHRAPTEQPARR
jgi:hypothetical protein